MTTNLLSPDREKSGMERRLAAILAADVVGYSRLIRADEEGTVEDGQEKTS